METEQPPLGEAEAAVLRRFLSGVGANLGETPSSQIQAVVFFPKIQAQNLMGVPQTADLTILWWGQDALKIENLLQGAQSGSHPSLFELRSEYLHRVFTPEVIIPPI